MKEEKENQKLDEASEETNSKLKIVPSNHNFIIVYDTVYKNTSLTADEGWLLIKLISAAPTFAPSKRKIMKIMNWTERRLLKATNDLQKRGYLKITKHGATSTWEVNQEPAVNLVKDLSVESLVEGLMNFDINMKQLYQLHKMKYIDDTLFNKVRAKYGKEMIRIAKTEWLKD